MSTKKLCQLCGPILVLALLLSGWANASPLQAQDEENVLVIAISGDVETLDPPFSRFQRSNEVNYNVYDQFFRYGWYDTGEGYSATDVSVIEGAAVESWAWSDDGLSITLNIRQGVPFPKTGREVTADDFIYWFERAYGTQSGTEWNCLTANINSMDQVEKLGLADQHLAGRHPNGFIERQRLPRWLHGRRDRGHPVAQPQRTKSRVKG